MRTNNARRKKLLALFLSLTMLSTAGAAFASCADEETSSSESSSSSAETETEATVKDDYVITNAGFETFDDNEGKNLIGTSVNGWSRATDSVSGTSAQTSTAASGIIDTAKDAWDNLTTSGLTDLTASELTEAQAKANWDSMTAKDKLEFYEAWEDNDDNEGELEDLEFYEAFNIDKDDLPLVKDGEDSYKAVANPGTHWKEGDKGYADHKDDTNVLMIHNEYSTTNYETFGTAQKYTSSSTVTVKAGTSAKLSVWVKTSNLQTATTSGGTQSAVDSGAYIRITNSLGSTSLDPLEVKNINTENMDEDSLSAGWAQYEFIVKGSSYADSTFTLVLGLGQGSKTDRFEWVNGYAFFDDITCETIETTNETIPDGYASVKISDKADKKVVNAASVDKKQFALDLSDGVTMSDIHNAYDLATLSFSDTREEVDSPEAKSYTSVLSTEKKPLENGVKTWEGLGFNPDEDITKVYDNVAAMNGSDNEYLQTVYDNYFKDTDFLKDNQILMLLSASGASYTATFDGIPLPAESYRIISFFAKTSNMTGFTGAGITVKDEKGEVVSSVAAFSTATLDGVKIGDDEDYYDGWQQCFVFLSNETDTQQDYTLELTFGPTTITESTASSYQPGFAAFAGTQWSTSTITEEQFAYAASGTYSLIANLDPSEEEGTGDQGFDSVSTGSTRSIKDGYADLKNYKGVTPDSAYIKASTNYDINTLATAGLLSKEELIDEDDNDAVNEKYTAILDALGANVQGYDATADIEDKWASIFGGDTSLPGYSSDKPLVIHTAEATAYGFIGTDTNITDYTVLSYRVKVIGDAKANFYLIDTNDEAKGVMQMNTKRTYWYDADGNVCSADPADSAFNKKKDVAFKLQSNGLYQLNPTWRYADEVENKDAYYANLQAYDKDANDNLIVAKGGVSYDYTSKWRNDGNDGIAYYYKDGKYYADSAKTVQVLDLASVEKLEARAQGYTGDTMHVEVGNTNGEWATVTFYLHPGDSGKNYRLEVWTGTRDGVTKSAATSTVIVDLRTPAALTAETFASYSEDRAEIIDNAGENEDFGRYFKGAFSFYDSAKFLRYDETADENGVGNSYDDFDPASSNYAESIAFLYYNKDNVYEVYADYAVADRTVTADVEETEEKETEEEETETESDINVWLLISSISTAAVLLLVILLIIFRKALGGKKRKTRVAKVKVKKEKAEKSAKKAASETEKTDETSPYND